MAAALPADRSAARRSRRSQISRRAQELRVLRRDRKPDVRRWPTSCHASEQPGPSARRAGRREVPDERRGGAHPRKESSSPRTCARCHSSKLPDRRRSPGSIPTAAPARSTWTAWNRYWTWTQTRRVQAEDARRSCSRPTSSTGQLSLDRHARARHVAAHQRLQPARDQRDRRQHLG